MKILVPSVFVFLILAGAPAQSQSIPGLDLDVTVTVPRSGDSSSGPADRVYGIGADAFIGIPVLPVKIGGRIAYNRLGPALWNGHATVTEFSPSIRYGLDLPYGIMNVFGQVGVGKYQWSGQSAGPQGTGLGKETGYGVSLGLGASAGGFLVMPMYHRMIKGKGSNYFTLNIGKKF